jgi:hypothetical protein
MAISIEQEKKKVNWLNIVLAIIIVGAIFIGGYFLFFKKPELIEVVVPGKFQDLSKLSAVEFNPQELLNSPKFKILRQFQVKTEPAKPGRSNPFQPF